MQQAFFLETSFWNQAIGNNPEIDPQSDHFIALLESEPTGNHFGINATKWTIPVRLNSVSWLMVTGFMDMNHDIHILD